MFPPVIGTFNSKSKRHGEDAQLELITRMRADIQEENVIIQQKDVQLRQKDVLLEKHVSTIQQLEGRHRQREEELQTQLRRKNEELQQRNADISTLQAEIHRLQVCMQFIGYCVCKVIQAGLRYCAFCTYMQHSGAEQRPVKKVHDKQSCK
jgi:septal ring factor EnvC (AmiA/AmiB activator)